MKPLIGLNLDISPGPPEQAQIQTRYCEPILASGGIPILLAPMPDSDLEEVLARLDGIVLIGGDDYSPQLYGEFASANVKLVDPVREDFDLRLMSRLIKSREMPVLGICGGCQLMNVGFGGSLIQDIVTQIPSSPVKHSGEPGWKVKDWHEVEVESDSQLFRIYKKQRFTVPTAHHQAIKVVGNGLKAVARTDDGIVEAVEAPSRSFMFGVQWHPERDYAGNEPLFREFIFSCAKVTSHIG